MDYRDIRIGVELSPTGYSYLITFDGSLEKRPYGITEANVFNTSGGFMGVIQIREMRLEGVGGTARKAAEAAYAAYVSYVENVILFPVGQKVRVYDDDRPLIVCQRIRRSPKNGSLRHVLIAEYVDSPGECVRGVASMFVTIDESEDK